jgi:uncharacterized damage-inducible protein DinB
MESRIPGFHGEYLWELDIARMQLLALAAAVPQEAYGWSPADGMRSFSAVLVHIAAGNIALLRLAGRPQPGSVDLYGPLQGDAPEQFAAMIRKNVSLERTLTEKQGVIDLLARSFEAVQQSFTASSVEELEEIGSFFGERTTVRRVYLRILAHTHEHMGQAITYARSYGIKVPWPDPLNERDRIVEGSRSREATSRGS